MFKKLVSLVLAVVFVFTAAISLASCGESSGNDDENPVKVDKSLITGDPSAIKVGVVLIGDENEGYSYCTSKALKMPLPLLASQNPDFMEVLHC